MTRAVTPQEAADEVLRYGFAPLEPYPGRTTCPWRMQHSTCGREVEPMLRNLRRTTSSGCRWCARARHRRRGPSTRLLAVLEGLALTPQVPYPGYDIPWTCLHTTCGRLVSPRAKNLVQGKSRGCRSCGALAREARRREERERERTT